jgi:very-short-patch-repair endonuclease
MYRDQNQRDFVRTLRNEPTDAEKRLWHFLRAQKLRGEKFRRQAPIGPYVVDFVCFSHKLIIELDGPQHLEPDVVLHDTRRAAWLAGRGFRIIRFRNQELDEDICAVVNEIASAIEELGAANPPYPTLPAEGRKPE